MEIAEDSPPPWLTGVDWLVDGDAAYYNEILPTFPVECEEDMDYKTDIGMELTNPPLSLPSEHRIANPPLPQVAYPSSSLPLCTSVDGGATRKRRKRDSTPNSLPPPSQATSLLQLEGVLDPVDSTTFEAFINEIRNFRSLTTAEEALVKKLGKKIKNRESARKSRQAKKDHDAGLESLVLDLEETTQALKIQAATLESENRQIRGEITFTENLISSHPVLSKLYFGTLQNGKAFNSLSSPGTVPTRSSILVF